MKENWKDLFAITRVRSNCMVHVNSVRYIQWFVINETEFTVNNNNMMFFISKETHIKQTVDVESVCLSRQRIHVFLFCMFIFSWYLYQMTFIAIPNNHSVFICFKMVATCISLMFWIDVIDIYFWRIKNKPGTFGRVLICVSWRSIFNACVVF